MEFDSTVVLALALNKFSQHHRNTFGYKLKREAKIEFFLLILYYFNLQYWRQWPHMKFNWLLYDIGLNAHLYKTLVHHCNLHSDQYHRNIYPKAGIIHFLCMQTRKFCMTAPKWWDSIKLCRKHRPYRIEWWSGKLQNYYSKMFRARHAIISG